MYVSQNMATEPLNFLYEIIDKLIRHDVNFSINWDYNNGFISLYTQIVPEEASDFDFGEFVKNTREESKEEQNESENDN